MQNLTFSLVFLLTAGLCSGSGGVFAMEKEKSGPGKAILIAAFGTSVPEAARAFDEMEKRVRESYPGVEVRWAFSSKIIRAKLAKDGKVLDAPDAALARLLKDGYTHVAVLSLHIVPGVEFHELARDVRRFREMSGGFQKIALARPLIGNYTDMIQVIELMRERYAGRIGPEDAVLFMGHGNGNHASDAIYVAAHYIFRERAGRFFLATVQGYPTLDEILPGLSASGAKKVHLVPFLAVAGEHARKDMAGEGPESWKSVLATKGIKAEPIFTGLAECPEVAAVWLEHLKEAFSAL
jgi:sirohydrochlorin cobaltochelatase